MSIITLIAIVLVLIVIIAYFKQLNPEQRAKQASVLRDVGAMSVVATATFATEAARAAVKSGQLAAKTVEAEHTEAIDKARSTVDTIIQTNGGTVRRAGITLGSKAADAVYLTDANKALDTAIADLKAKGF